MLLNLSLRNFVIVDELQLSFEDGFTVLTGETGAGKSITLDALGLLLGDKADFSQVRHGAKEAQLSALFSLQRLPELRRELTEQGLADEADEELTLRRIISAEGKSRNFINGQAATLAQLKKIGESLIDIHGQNAHHSLNGEAAQRAILDAFSGSLNQAAAVTTAYRAWQDAQQALDDARERSEQLLAERERLEWQQQELTKLAPQKGEWEELSQSYDLLAHAAELLTAAQNGEDIIDGDKGMQSQLARCMRELDDLAAIEPRFAESLELLASIEAELSEISANLRAVVAHTEIDPDELARQDERMREIAAAARKYHIDEDALPDKLTAVSARLAELDAAVDCEALQQKVDAAAAVYREAAAELTRLRSIGAEKFSAEVSTAMHELAMERAVFQAALIPSQASAHGDERVQYHIAMNRGSELRPLSKVASGGELARISLAIQVVASRYTAVPTLIFDEVDSGIGGRVADTVGHRLRLLGENYQVLVITHLAQVAACANRHWQVSKSDHGEQTVSRIQVLDENERIDEIARMIGGETLTATTREHAAEMLTLAARSRA
ncbi:MAG: DNA repair protein RecN [Neisseria sp.]|nr:DNA repair protein RecN [Neisseria sp.]